MSYKSSHQNLHLNHILELISTKCMCEGNIGNAKSSSGGHLPPILEASWLPALEKFIWLNSLMLWDSDAASSPMPSFDNEMMDRHSMHATTVPFDFSGPPLFPSILRNQLPRSAHLLGEFLKESAGTLQ